MTTNSQEGSSCDEITKYTEQDYTNLSKGKGKGLVNMSNTCYMNSALQSVLHIRPLMLWFQKNKYKDDLNSNKPESYLVHAMKLLVDNYFSNNSSAALCPTAFHAIINLLAHNRGLQLYQLGNQNDIHEFIQFFVDSLHEGLCYPIKANIKGTVKTSLDRLTLIGHKQWANFFREQYSAMSALFGCQLISTITCSHCNARSPSFTPEYCLTLSIPQKRKGQKGPVDLTDCFKKFIEPEIMDGDDMYACEKCKDKRQATKQISIWRTPKILIVLLKRFRTHGQHAAKINDMVTYPFKLDLTQFCTSFDSMNKSQYNLFSVCNHQGATGGGHYFAYCKDTDGKWRQYNDSSVSEISEERVITKDAYCLFYERV